MIESRADLIKILKDFGDEGCPADVLRRQGVATPTAAAAELRRSGHEVDVIRTGGGIRLIYRNPPSVGNRRRKKAQTSLFDITPRPRGAYDEEV